MTIAILGFGSQGKSAYEYWNHSGNEITICDSNESIDVPSDALVKLGNNYLNNLDEFDMIVRSPSIHPSEIISANSDEILAKVTSNTNEFMKACPSNNIIGVTGTKGKGTTSSLIAKMIEAAGLRVHLGGNIGIPPLELLKDDIQETDWVVLELANFQLIDLKTSPHIGVCLMVVPEHMDWHKDMEEYMNAKSQLFINQSEKDIAVYYSDNNNSQVIANHSQGLRVPYFQAPGAYVDNDYIVMDSRKLLSTSQVKLLGNHNLQNVCAAITAFWQISKDVQAITFSVETFSGLEHRLEKVAIVNGVSYYDDSFGTTPETAVVAIEAFEEPKIVILGGSDKGATYEKLARTVKNHNVKKAVLIGATASEIAKSLDEEGYTDYIMGPQTMPEIVATASELASEGDIILLSTGCASFGLFKNYKDRGEQFKQAVLKLQ